MRIRNLGPADLENVRVRFSFLRGKVTATSTPGATGGLPPSTKLTLIGRASADNADPAEVQDAVLISTYGTRFCPELVTGSTVRRSVNNPEEKWRSMDETIFASDGVNIGAVPASHGDDVLVVFQLKLDGGHETFPCPSPFVQGG